MDELPGQYNVRVQGSNVSLLHSSFRELSNDRRFLSNDRDNFPMRLGTAISAASVLGEVENGSAQRPERGAP